MPKKRKGDEKMAKKRKENRKEVLLRACYELLNKCNEGRFVRNVIEETAFYDGVDCDGACLMKDIAIELNILEDEY